MRLTSFTTYALRTLMVAAMRGDRLTRCQEVADAFGISHTHCLKCVHQLGVWGYLENVRGRSGGFRLAVPADRIVIGEVVRRTEDSLELVECFNAATNTCPLMEACRLSRTFKRALAAFLAVLDEVTIADVVANRAELMPMLELETAGPALATR